MGDGRIVAARSASAVKVSAGAEGVALVDKTVIPGIINTGGHVSSPADLRTYAAYGVDPVFISLDGEPTSVFGSHCHSVDQTCWTRSLTRMKRTSSRSSSKRGSHQTAYGAQ